MGIGKIIYLSPERLFRMTVNEITAFVVFHVPAFTKSDNFTSDILHLSHFISSYYAIFSLVNSGSSPKLPCHGQGGLVRNRDIGDVTSQGQDETDKSECCCLSKCI